MLFGAFSSLNAQNTYRVTYVIEKIKLHGSIDNLDERGKRFTKKVIDKAKSINFVLHANEEESYFEKEEILKHGEESPLEEVLSKTAQRFASFNKKTYINFVQDTLIFIRKLVGQDFTVKRNNINFNWVITNDTKKILDLDARRATGKYYNAVLGKEQEVEAWFIPSIQLKSGPDIFMGLPGLIAEIEIEGAIVTMKKIENNDNIKIKKIDDKKAINQQQYENLINKLTKQFIEN